MHIRGNIMSSAKRSSTDNVVKVDPRQNRPPNAQESVPEALVPDVVHTRLRRDPSAVSDSPEDSRSIAPGVSPGTPDRWQLIQRRAYEIAQERGFTPGAELTDWLQAEREIDEATQQAPAIQQTSPEDQFTG